MGGGQTISRPQAPPIPSPSEKVEKRSWPGAATLIIGIVTWLLVALSFISAALKLSSGLIGFLFLAGMFLGFFGILFGAVAFGLAFRSPERYGGKGLALIGLLMNLMPVLFVLLLLAIGIAVTIK
jgi:hypothetical protein